MDKHTSGPCGLEYDEQNGEFRLMLDTAIQSPGFHHVAHRVELYRDVYPDVDGSDPAQSSLYDEAMANSCRIEAMWNACEGISTEALEAGVVAEAIRLIREIRPHFHYLNGATINNPLEGSPRVIPMTGRFEDFMRDADALIARVKGGAA